jgi:tetratricopeptide (TPR) repeat protein
MSTSSSDQSNRARRPRAVPDLPQESFDDPQESFDGREWDERVAHEMRHQEVIEASFDRADAYARVGDFEQALEWLDRAAALSGGLSRAYRARRARWTVSTTLRLRPTGGDQNAPGPGGLRAHR